MHHRYILAGFAMLVALAVGYALRGLEPNLHVASAGMDAKVAQSDGGSCKALIEQRDQLIKSLGQCEGAERNCETALRAEVKNAAALQKRLDDLKSQAGVLEKKNIELASRLKAAEEEYDALRRRSSVWRGRYLYTYSELIEARKVIRAYPYCR